MYITINITDTDLQSMIRNGFLDAGMRDEVLSVSNAVSNVFRNAVNDLGVAQRYHVTRGQLKPLVMQPDPVIPVGHRAQG